MSISCKKATELIEKKSLFKLSISEKVSLKVHLSICRGCKNFKIQNGQIDEALKNSATRNFPKIELTDEQKQQILNNCK